MNIYPLDLDKVPNSFYGELKSISDTNAKWCFEKKNDFITILEKYKIPKINYMPLEKWKCSYCKTFNNKDHQSCYGCGVNYAQIAVGIKLYHQRFVRKNHIIITIHLNNNMDRTELEKDLSERLQCLRIFLNNNYMKFSPEMKKTFKSIIDGRVKYNRLERKLEMK